MKNLKLLMRYFKFNISAQMEYRVNFFIQIFGMIINNFFLLFFWWVIFSKVGKFGGYGMEDIYLIYSVVTVSFGISMTFFGNQTRISRIIYTGELDSYIMLPRPYLFHILISRISLSALGDVIFGILVFFMSGYAGFLNFIVLIIVCTMGAVIFAAFNSVLQSLTFYFGDSTAFSRVFPEAVLSFSMYPETVFNGIIKIVLFTVVPAGYFSFLPVRIIKDFNLYQLSEMFFFTVGFSVFAFLFFKHGLKKYESGNLIIKRL